MEWLKEYSPTGYFVINDYETRANKPRDHKKWDLGTTSPLGAVAVHETGHMRNLDLNSKDGRKSYYIGNLKDYAFTPDFTPFSYVTTSVWSNAEFRYFALRYIL